MRSQNARTQHASCRHTECSAFVRTDLAAILKSLALSFKAADPAVVARCGRQDPTNMVPDDVPALLGRPENLR